MDAYLKGGAWRRSTSSAEAVVSVVLQGFRVRSTRAHRTIEGYHRRGASRLLCQVTKGRVHEIDGAVDVRRRQSRRRARLQLRNKKVLRGR